MERIVSRPDLESLLGSIHANTSDPRAGIFGPDSITWRINRESALFLGAGRAALLQLAHPWVATALQQHSSLFGDPIARFHNTFRIVFTMIYGSLGQALAAARHLHTLHTRIQGELPESVSGWQCGARYRANEIAALRWVYATLVESAVLAFETVLPLAATERESYYQESKIMAALFGIPGCELPSDWSAFSSYTEQMAGELGATSAARSMADAVLSGAGSWVHPPAWYRALTIDWMPPRLRAEFGLQADPTRAARARRWLPRVYRALPASMRFVGPVQEAQARLRGRGMSMLIRWNNRFWIGQPCLPFGGQ
jgi:uncharacterized protein (DUF2236 family)